MKECRLKHDSLSLAIAVAIATVASSAISIAVCSWWHRRSVTQLTEEWQRRRQEERTGRIRAEVKLRTALKDLDKVTPDQKIDASMNITVIGTVVSPYTKRMGTPRQPTLVPASRGYIDVKVPVDTLSGIEDYSHVWVIFEFHANTDLSKNKTKIRPPRGGGKKVGQLATRSPHRPNSIGLSLVTIENWDEKERKLYISGLDLVHGTPVYDIKPCVPWDIPGYPRETPETALHVPSWVNQEDTIATVEFGSSSLEDLRHMVAAGRLSPLYTVDNDGFTAARKTLEQMLAQDPRSSHKGLKGNARGSTSQDGYRLVFCQCQITFVVTGTSVQVTLVEPIDFDSGSYVDGVPLISKA